MTADPSHRPGKTLGRVFGGIHLLIAVLFSSLLVLGIVRELVARDESGASVPATAAGCGAQVAAFQQELLDRLAAFPRDRPAAQQAYAYERWAMEFRKRFEAAQRACKARSGSTPEQQARISRAFSKVERLLALSAIHASHWTRHLGPAVDDASAAVDEALNAAPAPRARSVHPAR